MHAFFAFQILRQGDAVDKIVATLRRVGVTFAFEAAGAVGVAEEEKSLEVHEIHSASPKESLFEGEMAFPEGQIWVGF